MKTVLYSVIGLLLCLLPVSAQLHTSRTVLLEAAKKLQAVADILSIKNFPDFLKASGYAEKFSISTPATTSN